MPPLDRSSRVLAVALLVLPPLVVAPGLRDGFRLPKQVVAEIVALLLLTALAAAGRHGPWRRRSVRELLRQPAVVAVLPLAGVVVASALVSAHPVQARAAMLGFAVPAAVVGVLGARETRRLLSWSSVPAAVLAAIATVQWLWGSRLSGAAAAELAGSRLELTSLAGNVGDLGAFLVLPALIAQAELAGAGGAISTARRFGWGSLLALLAFALSIARTLTPLAALGVGSAVLWVVYARGRRRERALVLLAGAALAVLVLLLSPLRARLAEEWRNLRAGSVRDVLSGRLDGWRAGVEIARRHPLLGAGPGAYRAEFAPAKLALAPETPAPE